jgi:hypothetical protein
MRSSRLVASIILVRLSPGLPLLQLAALGSSPLESNSDTAYVRHRSWSSSERPANTRTSVSCPTALPPRQASTWMLLSSKARPSASAIGCTSYHGMRKRSVFSAGGSGWREGFWDSRTLRHNFGFARHLLGGSQSLISSSLESQTANRMSTPKSDANRTSSFRAGSTAFAFFPEDE